MTVRGLRYKLDKTQQNGLQIEYTGPLTQPNTSQAMLLSPDHKLVVSNLGWVDKSSLWTYDVDRDDVNLIPVGNGKYLSLYPCKNPNQFTVFHHTDNELIRITIHSFDKPGVPLCTMEYSAGKSTMAGALDALQNAPQYYVAYFKSECSSDFHLVAIDANQCTIHTETFPWYDNTYDKGYQGIVGVLALSSGELIVSIQRNSHPIVYDPKTRRVVRKLWLANRHGNPTFLLAKKRNEIWADDYDTILKFDGETLGRKGWRCLQATAPGTAQFIGGWAFNEDESLCLVSRPYSGDVIAISTENLRTKYIAKTGSQPFRSVFLDSGQILGRDWKTGAVLKSSLQRKWLG